MSGQYCHHIDQGGKDRIHFVGIEKIKMMVRIDMIRVATGFQDGQNDTQNGIFRRVSMLDKKSAFVNLFISAN